MKLKRYSPTGRSYTSESISLKSLRYAVVMKANQPAPDEIDLQTAWGSNSIHFAFFALPATARDWNTFLTTIENNLAYYEGQPALAGQIFVACFDQTGNMVSQTRTGIGTDGMSKNDSNFALGNNHNLYQYSAGPCQLSLPAAADGSLRLRITAKGNQGLSYGQAAPVALLNNLVEFELTDQPTNGAMKFGLSPAHNDLKTLNFGLTYFIPFDGLGNPLATVQSNIFAPDPGNTYTLDCIFYPFQNTADALGSTFNFTAGHPALVSSFKTDDGHFASVQPVADANPATAAGFAFHQFPSSTDSPGSEYYPTPQGGFTLLPQGGGEAGLYYLQTGRSGTQALSFGAGDTLHFTPGQPARIFGHLDTDNASVVLDGDLSKLRLSNDYSALTSWLAIVRASDPAGYYDQPQNSATYSAGMTAGMAFNHIKRANQPGTTPLPIFSHRGFYLTKNGNNVAEGFFEELENKVMAASRNLLLGAPPVAGLLHDVAAPTPLPSLTPQGYLVSQTGDAISSITYGISDSLSITVNNPTTSYISAILRDKVFAPFSSAYSQVISGAGSGIILSLMGGTYTFDLYPASAIKSYFLQKFHNVAISDVLAGNVSAWSNYDPAVQMANLQSDIQNYIAPYQADTEHYTDFFKKRWENASWDGILVLHSPVTLLPPILQGLINGSLPPATYLGIDVSSAQNNASITLNQSSVFGIIDYTNPDTTLLMVPADGDFNYRLDRLLVRFENSRIVDFECKVEIALQQLFYETLKLDTGDNTLRLTIDGSYNHKDGKDIYTFVWTDDLVIPLHNSIIDSVILNRIEYQMIDGSYSFVIDGALSFGNLKATLGIDLFSFDKLSINGLRLNFKNIAGSASGFQFDASHINFNINLNIFRGSSLFDLFPLKLKNFLFGGSRAGTTIPMLDPGSLGFLPVNFTGFFGGFNFGLVLDLDLGSLGGLLGDMQGFTASFLLSWLPGMKGLTLGLGLPNATINSFDVGIQGIIDLHADKLILKEENGIILIQLMGAYLGLLGLQTPPVNGALAMKLSSTAKLPGMSWFVSNDPGKNPDFFMLFAEQFALASTQARSATEAVGSAINNSPSDTSGDDTNIDYTTFISAGSGTLFALRKNGIAGLFDLNVIFWDNTMYGLAVTMKGIFSFDILYKKISNKTGQWSTTVALPDILRNMQLGPVGVVLPDMRLVIYTDGGFEVDLGMPTGFDYSGSAAFSMPPFVGGGGFDFGLLTGADVPDMAGASFVIQAGMAARLGLGFNFGAGPLSAGVSVSVAGSLEGQFGYKGKHIELLPDYFYLEGTVGAIGELYGYVDFGIIKAGLRATIDVGIGLIIGTNHKTILFIDGGIQVQASVDIDLGFFSITLHFSFGMHVHFEWQFGSGSSASPLLVQLDKLPLLATADPVAAFRAGITKLTPATTLSLFFFPEVTVQNGDVYFLPMLQMADNKTDASGNSVFFPAMLKTAADALLSLVYSYLQNNDATHQPTYDEIDAFEQAISAPMDENILTPDLVNSHIFKFSVGTMAGDPVNPTPLITLFFPMLSGVKLSSALFQTPVGATVVDYSQPQVDMSYQGKVAAQFDDYFVNYNTAYPNVPTPPPGGPMTALADMMLCDYFDYILKSALSMVKQQLQAQYVGKTGLGSATWASPVLDPSRYPDLAGQVNRFFRSGLRVPKPNDTAHCDGLFNVLGQQFMVDFTVTDTTITIDYGSQHSTFTLQTQSSNNGLKLYAGKSPSTNLNVRKTLIDPFTFKDYSAALSNTIVASNETLYQLPKNLSKTVFRQTQLQLPLSFGLNQGTNAAQFTDLNTNAAGSDYIPVTVIRATLTPSGSANLYKLGGMNADQAFLLNEMAGSAAGWQGLSLKFLAITQTATTVSYTELGAGSNITILKTNLSTASRPPADPAFRFFDLDTVPVVPYKATVGSDNIGFINLLKEYSIVNDDGYFIKADSWTTAPSAVTTVAIVIRRQAMDSLPHLIEPFHTHVIPQNVLQANNTWFMASDGLKQVLPVRPPYATAFQVQRLITPSSSDPYQTTVDSLFGILEYSISSPAGSKVSPITEDQILPATPEAVPSDSTQWQYGHVVPLVSKTAGKVNPDGTLSVNRYQAVGSAYTLNFNWRDLYGNTADSGAFSLPVSQHSYYDPLVGLSAWPMIAACYDASQAGALTVTLNYTFNSALGTQYLGKAADQYSLIIDQLTDAQSVRFFATLFNDQENLVLQAADPKADMLQFLSPIWLYLQDKAAGNPGTPPQNNSKAFVIPMPQGSLKIGEPVQLEVQMAIIRNYAFVHPGLKLYIDASLVTAYAGIPNPPATNHSVSGANEVFVSLSDISPLITTVGSTATSALAKFAADIRQNLQVTGDEVIAGTGLNSDGEHAIWLMSKNWLSPAVTPGNNSDHQFSPQPISLTPWTGTVQMSDQTNVDVVNNDLDKTMRLILSGIDTLLSGQTVNTILGQPAIGSEDAFSILLNAKSVLAEFYAGHLINVKQNDSTLPSDLVTDEFKQDLLKTIGDAYGADVLVTLPYDNGLNNQQEYRLWYEFATPVQDENFMLNPIKVERPAGNVPAQLHFMVDFPTIGKEFEPRLQAQSDIAIKQVEHSISTGADGYDTSLWIQLIEPLTASGSGGAPFVDVTIPVIIKEYPQLPAILTHSFTQPASTATDLNGIVQAAKTWDYLISYNGGFDDQDDVYMTIDFNTDPAAQADVIGTRGILPGFNVGGAIQSLQAWKTIAPLLSGGSAADLAKAIGLFITGVSSIVQPINTLELLEDDFQPFSATFKINVPVEYQTNVNGFIAYVWKTADTAGYFNLATDVNLTLYAQEPPPTTGSAGNIVPLAASAGGSVDPATGALKLIFPAASNLSLTPQKDFMVNNLDILKVREAWPGISITRNEDVLDVTDGGGISKAFVYSTPPIKYGNALTPFLSAGQTIGDGQMGQTLQQHIQTLLNAIFTDGAQKPEPDTGGFMSVECLYCDSFSYEGFSGDAVSVLTPVGLIPNLPANNSSSASSTISTMISNWQALKKPNLSGSSYQVDIKLFATNAGSQLPLLELKAYTIPMSAISTAPPAAPQRTFAQPVNNNTIQPLSIHPKITNMKTSTKIIIWVAVAAAVFIAGMCVLYHYQVMLCCMVLGGLIAGLVNFFYVFLNLPLSPPDNSSAPKPLGLFSLTDTDWEQPNKTYWLALAGYLIIGITGAFLTPLIDAILTLKGDINTHHWILLGYAIVFGFGTNRLLSNVLNTVLAQLSTPKKAPDNGAGTGGVKSFIPLQQFIRTSGKMARAASMPGDFSDLINVPNLDTGFAKGIDISHYNAPVTDWDSIIQKDIRFVLIKTSDGVGTPDAAASGYANSAKTQNLMVGYYHFGRPDMRSGGTVVADAQAEADDFYSRLQTLPAADATIPYFLDLEDVPSEQWDTNLGPDDYLLWVQTFLQRMTGYMPAAAFGVYSRKEYLDSKLPDGHNLGSYMLWLSRYINDYNQADPVKGWTNWGIWQFTDIATIGTNGQPFDLNIMKLNT